MGYPGKCKKQYETPRYPWQEEKLEEDANLIKRYGLRNKRELWRAESTLRKYRRVARRLLAKRASGMVSDSTKREIENLLESLKRRGVLELDGELDDILALTVEDFLNRRLQTLVVQKNLASSMRQARQFIVHGHIALNDRRITIPGYMVNRGEESNLDYYPGSPITDEMHPVRPAKVVETGVPVEGSES
ncbi:MAG: Ribosomal protein S4/S9, eukaryotic/archaeal [Candidatus Syntrophoarchaeum caldarius]|uniref:Small ribosomal subunit protein uS4 n=1 Tax=Candidatus Syntropharchaeum caldarium TaxID=1838285 RepID=A0A1F2PAK0_9EURY|nr:MAG: Ribosomal protein S4/S9, eukaryotic/archaeal [Candidatus Syntrophoarchaeum caldarius]